ncbi:MAG: hypothetical protein HYU97_00775 [Deltaproteobacteria bacterium]|nr:hypothetical protein [Deltaproteobacteria bacterium]
MQNPNMRRTDCAITICPNGCICLHFGVTAIHLSYQDFLIFVQNVAQTVLDLDERKRPAYFMHETRVQH